MRITIGSFVICEGVRRGQYTASQFPDQLELDSINEVQPRKAIRAKAAKLINRGNTEQTIAFTMTREHTSHAEANEWAMVHFATIPKEGAVTFTLQKNSGTYKKMVFNDATIKAKKTTPIIGKMTVTRYTIVGGDFTVEA